MAFNLLNILNKLEPYVHCNLANDIVTFLYISNEGDIFSNKPYSEYIGFNRLLGFTPEHAHIFRIYTGFLGNGEYIHIYFDIQNGYSIELSDFSGNHKIHYESDCWDDIKTSVDDYFFTIFIDRLPLNDSSMDHVLYSVS